MLLNFSILLKDTLSFIRLTVSLYNISHNTKILKGNFVYKHVGLIYVFKKNVIFTMCQLYWMTSTKLCLYKAACFTLTQVSTHRS